MWVFGYGSLMWDGWEKPLNGTRVDCAVLAGYRRSFNKKSTRNWGTREAPGPTLGLEVAEDGSCTGTAFEFPEGSRAAVEALLKDREGLSFTLKYLTVRLPDGRKVEALTPVNDQSKGTYVGKVPAKERAVMAKIAKGKRGNCIEYVRNIHAKLGTLGIDDEDVAEFMRLVDLP